MNNERFLLASLGQPTVAPSIGFVLEFLGIRKLTDSWMDFLLPLSVIPWLMLTLWIQYLFHTSRLKHDPRGDR